MVSLLDVNLLVALAWPNHVHHQVALSWFQKNQASGWATCPVTQSGYRLTGYRQVTDAHLLTLALHRGGRLATLDRKIQSLVPPGAAAADVIALVLTE
jgi:predicted nucleic acid-binding protein